MEDIDLYISYYKQDEISKDMEDIDKFIKKNKDEQEYKDFIEKNIYPTFLTNLSGNPYRIEKFPELPISKGNSFKIENIENINKNIERTFDKLNKFENQIKDLIEKENVTKKENKENSCPICLEPFKPTSYFMPECGHKICLHCFTKNMIQNQTSGGFCCLCREKIIPKI